MNYENRIKHQVAAASDADAMLRMETIQAMTGLSRSGIYKKIADGLFPRPVKLGPRASRWPAGVIRAWVRQQAAA